MAIRGRLLGGNARWKIGRNVQFVGPVGRFRFGKEVCFYGNNYLNASNNSGYITIGERTHIDVYSVLYGQGGICIGSDCALAAGVIIYSQSNKDCLKHETPVSLQPTFYSKVTIGYGCWLGAGARVIPGVTISDLAHIGAGAVVTSDIPKKVVAVGVPAKILKSHET